MKKLTSEDTEGMKVRPNNRNFPANYRKGFHFGWMEDSSESIWEPRTRNTGESLSGQTDPRWTTQTGKKDPTTERQEDVASLGANVLVNPRTSQQVCVCMVELISLERFQRKQDLLRKRRNNDVILGAINRIVKQSYPLSAREPVVKLSLSICKM